ncbi:hypothetical protein QYE76_000539 [Lolium multiflorum]|uniref:TF-B3 domain-containing protein n=1 Tax=Lolium multiflorum TaxID=4521 RepID=A0AAD8VXR6_LOLMU|nr:hypothetical protein QYE76_000539 [Lolium multiflorum]
MAVSPGLGPLGPEGCTRGEEEWEDLKKVQNVDLDGYEENIARQSCTVAVVCDAVVFIVRPAGGVPSVVRVRRRPQGRPLSIQRLPDKFADFVASNEPTAQHLRETGCDCCRWPMDVLFDGCGKMYLHTCWEKFARYHDLEAGCVLIFSYLGDADMSIKVFDDTRCRRQYHGDSDDDDD